METTTKFCRCEVCDCAFMLVPYEVAAGNICILCATGDHFEWDDEDEQYALQEGDYQ